MSRYSAAAGVRNSNGSINNTGIAQTDPFILIFAPSGQVATVAPPSGAASSDQDFAGNFRSYWHTFSHVPLAWFRNEIVTSMRNTPNTGGTDWGFAWQPYGQEGGQKINDLGYTYAGNVSLSEDLMFDGFNWKIILWPLGAQKSLWSFKRISDGAFFTGPFTSAYQVPSNYGNYKGLDPVRTGNLGGGSSPFGWRPRSGIIGTPPADVIASASFDLAGGNLVNPGGIRNVISNINSLSFDINDILEHNGTIYVAFQHSLVALRFGSKGQYLYSEVLFNDSGSATLTSITKSADYTSRLEKSLTGGSKPRSLSSFNNEVFMLDNDGAVHIVKPNTVEQVADLTTLGTPWASGIFGGPVPGESTTYTGTSFRRHLLVNFNNQLHAFMNFQTNFQKAKGVVDDATNLGRGVFWATSFDGRNWKDFSDRLPASGIHSPSGGGVTAGIPKTQVTNWLTTIAPYRFSGFTGDGVTPFPAASGDFPTNYGEVGIGGSDNTLKTFAAQPSGYRQDTLPLWTSGILVDPENTSFDQLKVPLTFGSIERFLFPTIIRYPAGFGLQNGLFLPSGIGPSGYDYTGCRNYHISGFVDDRSRRLKLCFSEDFIDGGALTFELDQASGWHRTNWLPNCKQLNGYVPIMLYDPEVIIPSGDILNPNPRIDEVNKELTLRYRLYDWPFWDQVNVVSEYSTDYGQSWNFIRNQKGLSAGSLQTDPSGVNGVDHTLVWRYSDKTDAPHPLSKNVWYPHVQIRLRAIDPDFSP